MKNDRSACTSRSNNMMKCAILFFSFPFFPFNIFASFLYFPHFVRKDLLKANTEGSFFNKYKNENMLRVRTFHAVGSHKISSLLPLFSQLLCTHSKQQHIIIQAQTDKKICFPFSYIPTRVKKKYSIFFFLFHILLE